MQVYFCRFYDFNVILMSLIKEQYEEYINGKCDLWFRSLIVSDRKVRVYQKSTDITLASLISTPYISISRNKIIPINNNIVARNCYQ